MSKIGHAISKKKSRTMNTALNLMSGIGGQLLNLLLQFIVRTVFVQTLGKAYLGIGGVFSNILSMLSLAELGVGSAILFKLYDPIARNDQHRIAVLMRFYRTAYQFIGAFVAVIGLVLIPFLQYLVKDYGRLEAVGINAVLIYILFLSRAVSSYFFFAYKSAIINANQQEYLVNVIKYIGSIVSSILQIILLLTVADFTLYVLVTTFTVIGENLVTAYLAGRMYPYINERTDEKLSREEIKGLFKDCLALVFYRLNGVVLKATDNLVLSGFIGIDIVALYSNYYIIYTAISNISNRLFGSVTHSLGNLHTEHNVAHEYSIYKVMCLIAAIFGGTACVGIACVIDEFVGVWIGQEWVIAAPFAVLMGLEAYTLPIKSMQARLRSSMGLFQQGKSRPIIGMAINLVLSIALVQVWGVHGVILATIIADWATLIWYDPIVIHKHGYHNYKPVSGYFLRLLKYTLTTVAVGALNLLICRNVLTGHGWLSVVFHAVICALTTPAAILAVSWRTEEAAYVRKRIRSVMAGMIRKIKGRG